MSVWMITYRKAICLGVFYLIVAYLGKAITKAALELDAQQQRDCDISVTQQADSNWKQPGETPVSWRPQWLFAPSQIASCHDQNKHENYVRTMDAEFQLTPNGSMLLTGGTQKALSRKEMTQCSEWPEILCSNVISWCCWINVFLFAKKISGTKADLGPGLQQPSCQMIFFFPNTKNCLVEDS